MDKPTEGRRILITRSEPGAGRLAEALNAAGWSTVKLPLVQIEPIRDHDVGHAGRQLPGCDILIFTSAHAVVHGFDVVARHRRGAPSAAIWIAVGAATAAALRERKVEPEVPDVERSEGILAMPALRHLAGRRVAIVGGVGGRRILDAELEARGAEVVRLTVYRRVAQAPDAAHGAAHGAALDSAGLAAVVVSSVTGAEALVEALARVDETPAALARVPLVVPSPRVAQAAAALGFGNVLVSEGAGPAAVLAVLATIREDDHGG